MELDGLIDKLTFYEGFLDSFLDRSSNTLRENDLESLKMLGKYLIDAKNHLKDNKCEFFYICKHKFLRPKPTIIELKKEDLDIKHHCTDINSLTESFAYCTIREKVLNILEGS